MTATIQFPVLSAVLFGLMVLVAAGTRQHMDYIPDFARNLGVKRSPRSGCYRYPTILEESVLDVFAGISYLQSEGLKTIALTGYSFGGAVVTQAAASAQAGRTVVTLATQSYSAMPVSQLSLECGILLPHGTVDQVLVPACSEYIHQIAHEPKRLILYEDAVHSLHEVSEEVFQVVPDWIVKTLN